MTTLFEQLFPEQLRTSLEASAGSLQPNQLSRFIPTGNFNPFCYEEMGLTDQQIIQALAEEHDMLAKLGERVPPALKKDYRDALQRFRQNSQRTLNLINFKLEARRELSPHCWFPFAEDFDTASHQLFDENEYPFVEPLVFEPNELGVGWFGAVYTAKDPFDISKQFAFKLSRSPRKERPLNRPYFMFFLNHIRENLLKHAPSLDPRYFVPFRAISKQPFPNQDERDFENRLGYLMDLFPSKSLSHLVRKKSSKLKDKGFLARAVQTYALALQSLHQRGLILVDNNLGSLLVGDNQEMKLCDYDFLTPEDETLKGKYYPYPRGFRARESFLFQKPTKLGDLESLALMTSYLFLGVPIRPPKETDEQIKQFTELAREDDYHPPKELLLKIPQNLREVVIGLVSYPRDSSLTARDFLSAIKDDYEV